MIHNAVRLLKAGVHLVLGRLGYKLVKLPKDRPVLPVESKNLGSPDGADAFAPVAVKVAAIRKLKQEAFEHTMPGYGNVLEPDWLEPFKALVHLQHQYRQDLKIDQPAIRIIGGDWLRNIG